MSSLILKVMLLGPWKSAEEVEETLSLPELTGLLQTHAEQENNNRVFMAALKGIDLGQKEDAEERFKAAQRRAEATLAGKTEDELDFEDIGIDYE